VEATALQAGMPAVQSRRGTPALRNHKTFFSASVSFVQNHLKMNAFLSALHKFCQGGNDGFCHPGDDPQAILSI
jgi:hypothetical protein